MTVIDEKEHFRITTGNISETVSYFYWNVFKQNAFWSFCILIPTYIFFLYFAYDYLKGGFITQWEVSKIMKVALFTILPAGMLLNRILYYHAYNLIMNLGSNFFTPYRLGKQFDDYFRESLGFFLRASVPFFLFMVALFYSQHLFNSLVWLLLVIVASVLYEIVVCTYGLSVAASVSYGYRKPQDWNFPSSVAFFRSNKTQVISYAIFSMVSSILLICISVILAKISTIIALLFVLFSGSLIVILRATLHAKLLENTNWIIATDASREGDAVLGEFVKNNYILILGAIISVIVWFGYSTYQDSKYLNGRLIPDPIAPIAREKGTLDYTLIDWTFRDKEYFEHWVLRFPESAEITRPEDTDSKPINGRLTFYLRMPDMNFLSESDGRYGKDVARVSVNAQHQNFKEIVRNLNGQIETGFSGLRHQLSCVQEKEIAKGFFQMRDATIAEKEAYGPSYKYYLKDKCGFSKDHVNFAHYNSSGDILAQGKCRISDIFKSERASCDFRIWLPQERVAYVYLAPKYLEDFPIIYERIVDTINDATVIEHSTNLKWRPSKGSKEHSLSEHAENSVVNQKHQESEVPVGKVTDDVRLALMGCEIPAVHQEDKIILLGVQGGSALSSVATIGPDKSTSAAEVFIEEGPEPLYLVMTSFENMIWRISGSTERISNIVLSSASGGIGGPVGSGITGVDKSKVNFVTNPRRCISYFTDADSSKATEAKDAVHALTGRFPDQILGISQLGTAILPSGPVEQLTRSHTVPRRNALNYKLLNYFPSGVMKFDPADVVSKAPAETYKVLPGYAGLIQLIEEGKLEQIFSDEFRIIEKIKFPSGLLRTERFTFHLPIGVPRPDGKPGRSKVCLEATNKDLVRGKSCRYRSSANQ